MPSQRPGVDDNGNATCPMLHVEWIVGDDDNRDQRPHTSVCGAELYLTWSFSIPFGPGDHVDASDAPMASVAHGWTVECTNGHVLALSSEIVNGGDTAEAADFGVLFGG